MQCCMTLIWELDEGRGCHAKQFQLSSLREVVQGKIVAGA